VIQYFLNSAYGRTATPQEITGYRDPLMTAGTERSFVDMVKTSTPTTIAELQAIGKSGIPVMAVWGDKDSWVPVSDAYKLQAILKNMQLNIVSGAHHCPMETDPAKVNELLLNWLK
jgi:pimeloyl-ACP methyl ester carboxylesterase